MTTIASNDPLLDSFKKLAAKTASRDVDPLVASFEQRAAQGPTADPLLQSFQQIAQQQPTAQPAVGPQPQAVPGPQAQVRPVQQAPISPPVARQDIFTELKGAPPAPAAPPAPPTVPLAEPESFASEQDYVIAVAKWREQNLGPDGQPALGKQTPPPPVFDAPQGDPADVFIQTANDRAERTQTALVKFSEGDPLSTFTLDELSATDFAVANDPDAFPADIAKKLTREYRVRGYSAFLRELPEGEQIAQIAGGTGLNLFNVSGYADLLGGGENPFGEQLEANARVLAEKNAINPFNVAQLVNMGVGILRTVLEFWATPSLAAKTALFARLSKPAQKVLTTGVRFATKEAITGPERGQTALSKILDVGISGATGAAIGAAGEFIPQAVFRIPAVVGGFAALTKLAGGDWDDVRDTVVTVLAFEVFGLSNRVFRSARVRINKGLRGRAVRNRVYDELGLKRNATHEQVRAAFIDKAVDARVAKGETVTPEMVNQIGAVFDTLSGVKLQAAGPSRSATSIAIRTAEKLRQMRPGPTPMTEPTAIAPAAEQPLAITPEPQPTAITPAPIPVEPAQAALQPPGAAITPEPTPTTPLAEIEAPAAVEAPPREVLAQVLAGKGVKGDRALDALDLAETLADKGGDVTGDAEVVLFHRTTLAAARKIVKTGEMVSKEDRLFFGTSPTGQIEGYGDAAIRVTLPLTDLELNDVFTDEAHVTLKSGRPGTQVKIDAELVDLGKGAAEPSAIPEPAKGTVALAKKLDVDLTTVTGTGTDAKILAKDIRQAALPIEGAEQRVAAIDKARARAQLAGETQVKKRIRQVTGQVDLGKKIPKTPAQLLRFAKQHEAKAAAKGFRAGQIELSATLKELGEFVRTHIPKSEQGNILPVLAKARTPVQRRAVVRAVQRIGESIERKAALDEFKVARKNVRANLRSLRPKEKASAIALLDALRETEPLSKTLNRMERVIKAADLQEQADIPGSLIGRARSILAAQQATPLRKLPPDTIRSIAKTLDHIVHLSNKKQERYFGTKQRKVEDDLKDSVTEIQTRHPLRVKVRPGELVPEKRQGFLRWLATTGQLSVDSVAGDFGGPKSRVHELLVDAPLEGQRQFLSHQRDARQYATGKLKGLNFTRKEVQRWQTQAITTALPTAIQIDPSGKGRKVKDIQLTQAQRVDLIGHLSDPSTREQLSKRKAQGIKVEGTAGRPIKLFAGDIAALEASFTDREKAVSVAFKDYLNGPMRETLNTAWKQIHGYTLAERTDYWPRKRDWESREVEPDAILRQWIENQLVDQGIFKPRRGGLEAILVSDAFAKWQTHINRVSAMAGKHAPLLDALRLLKSPEFVRSVKTRVKAGREKLIQIEKAMVAYRGMGIPPEGKLAAAARRVTRRAHVGILGAKPHIAAYQVASLLTSIAEMQTQDVLKVWNWRLPTKGVMDQMLQSPVFEARFSGAGHQILSPETATATSLEFYFGEATGVTKTVMSAIKFMDKLAVVNIYEAARSEGRRRGLEGQGLTDWALRRAEEVTYKTQPTWDPLTIGALGVEAKHSMIARLLTLFSSQRNKNFNILYRAQNEFKHSKKTYEDYRQLAKRVSAIVLQAVIIYEIGQFFRSKLTRREEEQWAESWSERVWGTFEKLVGNWLVIGAAATEVLNQIRSRALGKRPRKPRGNLLTDAAKDTYEAIGLFYEAAENLATQEEFKEEWRKGKLKWPDMMLRAADRAANPTAIVTGAPIPAAWQLVRQKLITTERGNTFHYNRLWDAAGKGDDKVLASAVKVLKSRGVTIGKLRASQRSRKISDADWQIARKAFQSSNK